MRITSDKCQRRLEFLDGALQLVPPFIPLFGDLVEGLKRQMFFWGKDAIHPQGNHRAS